MDVLTLDRMIELGKKLLFYLNISPFDLILDKLKLNH